MAETYVAQAPIAPMKHVQGRVRGTAEREAPSVIVGLGTLTQPALGDRPTAEIDSFIACCHSVGLRTPLERAGLAGVRRADLMSVAEAATAPGETTHNLPFPIDATIVCDAMIAADAYGPAFAHAPRGQRSSHGF